MKNLNVKISLMLLFAVVLTLPGFSQVLSWQFALPSETLGNEVAIDADIVADGLEISSLTRGPNAVPGPRSLRAFVGFFPINKTKEEAQKSGAYYQFIVKVKKGYTLSLTDLNVVLRRQDNSPYMYRWMYSTDGKKFQELGEKDGILTNLSNNGEKQAKLGLTENKDLQQIDSKTKVIFRLYAWGAESIDKKAKRAFGIGKSNKSGSKALWLNGKIEKVK